MWLIGKKKKKAAVKPLGNAEINAFCTQYGPYGYYISLRYYYRFRLMEDRAQERYWRQMHENIQYLFELGSDSVDQNEVAIIVSEEQWEHDQRRKAQPPSLLSKVPLPSLFRRLLRV